MSNRWRYRPRDYILALTVLFFGWQILAMALHSPVFPYPAVALNALAREISGEIGKHLLVSLWRVMASTVFALVLGLPIGLYLGRTRERLGSLLLYLTYPLPKVIFLPVLMVLLGIGNAPKVFLISLILFFQIVVTVRDAAAGVNPQSIISVVSLGATEWDIYRHVLWPASLPKVFTALRLSVGTAIAVLFLAETFATSEGLGYFIIDSWSSFNYPRMFAGVMTMGALGFALYLILDWIEPRVCPWNHLER